MRHDGPAFEDGRAAAAARSIGAIHEPVEVIDDAPVRAVVDMHPDDVAVREIFREPGQGLEISPAKVESQEVV